MSSLFDSEVRIRQQNTPWAVMNFLRFGMDVALNGSFEDQDKNHEVVIRIRYRHDVASRYWYEIEWTGADGERYSASSQDFDLMLWRAAEIEMRARRRAEQKAENKRAKT